MFRIATLLLVLLLIGLQYKLHRGEGGRDEVVQVRAAVRQQEAENVVLRKRNADLAAEIEDLKGGTAAIEERARGELGMIKPGEVFYRVAEPTPAKTSEP